MSENLLEVTDQSFGEKVLQSDKPVIVDFWAPWCTPCLRMAPTYEKLANEYAGKITFAKLNTDDNQGTAFRLGIQGIPTMIIFSGGKEVDRVVGLVPGEVLKRHLDSVSARA
ncbi:MAG TPA: thioredoxin [Ktedonobacterales bacterium]